MLTFIFYFFLSIITSLFRSDLSIKPLLYNALQYIKSANKPYLIIANKADKIAVTKVEDMVLEIKKELNLKTEEIILPFSSERKIYTDNVWSNLLIGVDKDCET